MRHLKQISLLIEIDWKTEIANWYQFSSILLFAGSTTYLIYYLLETSDLLMDLTALYWSLFFWITVLFSAINTVQKSFSQDTVAKNYYYYTQFSAQQYIIAKLVYNILQISLLTGVNLFIFSLFIGNPVQNMGLFTLAAFLGAAAYASVFTLITALANKASNNATLSAVLGLPLCVPILIFISKLTNDALLVQPSNNLFVNVCMLFTMNIILIILSIILFPYIWRD